MICGCLGLEPGLPSDIVFTMLKSLSWLSLACALIYCAPVFSQSENAPDILIRNVTMIDPAAKAEDRLVNILIRNQKLEVITEDKISRKEADQVINAQGGFIV